MNVLKGLASVLLAVMLLWRSKVLGRPSAPDPQQCTPTSALKNEYSRQIQILMDTMNGLWRSVLTSPPSRPPSKAIPQWTSDVKPLQSQDKTLDKLGAYFSEMDKYTGYLTGRSSIFHRNLLQTIKNAGTSLKNYCNCPSQGKQHFVFSNSPAKNLNKHDTAYVHYQVRISLHDIYTSISKKLPIRCE